ncbi:hypothetical protein LAZ67_15000550 [Cordylochernes scorpioides]|uniref:Uncharacterized protein n=1 Tax=Cordylochernes scorpioides TaxID=51811 RepID=A0ABY6LCZ0_9ARAC|nr:hypothetical protein LAZ67_15000550 [Cordylochernes scorpioides]
MVEMFNSDPHWLKIVIMGDETSVYGYEPETKSQSSQRLEHGEPRFKKARMIKSKLKCLLITFFDVKELVYYEFVPEEKLCVRNDLKNGIRKIGSCIMTAHGHIRPSLYNFIWLNTELESTGSQHNITDSRQDLNTILQIVDRITTTKETTTKKTIPLGLQTIPLGLQTIPLDLQTIPLGLQTIPLDLQTIALGLQTIPLGLQTIPLGLQTIPLGLQTIPLDLQTIPLGLQTIPLGLQTIPLGLQTIPLDLQTIPLGLQIFNEIRDLQKSLITGVMREWLGSGSLAFSLLLAPAITAHCRHGSARLTAVLGGLILALACLFSAFATRFHQVVLSYGLLAAAGAALVRGPADWMLTRYFRARLPAAEAIAQAGAGLGHCVFSASFGFGTR